MDTSSPADSSDTGRQPAKAILARGATARWTRGLVFDAAPNRLAATWLAERVRAGRQPALWPALRLGQVQLPTAPDAEWLTLAPAFVGICGSDVTEAQLRADLDNPLSALVSFPHVMGHEIVARVVDEAGQASPTLQHGDWVVVNPWLGCAARGVEPCASCGQGLKPLCARVCEPVLPGQSGAGLHLGNVNGLPGGFSSLMLAHASQCRVPPPSLEPRAAVLTDPLAVALRAVHRAEFRGGGVALVLGAGTIALCAAFVLTRTHPRVGVVVSAAWAHQRTAVEALGAMPVGADPRHVLRAVADLSEGKLVRPWRGEPWIVRGGAEIVIDAVGSAASTELALRAVQPGGRVVRVGVGLAGRLQSTLAYYKEVSLVGCNGYSDGEFDQALDLLAGGGLPYGPWLTHTFPLSQWRRAFGAAARPDLSGAVKVTLRPDHLGERTSTV